MYKVPGAHVAAVGFELATWREHGRVLCWGVGGTQPSIPAAVLPGDLVCI